MDYGVIGKIEKAKMYAEQPDRIQFSSFKVTIQGDNDGYHTVGYDDGVWSCDCNFFGSRGYCSHTMAMERVLTVMIPTSAEAE
ncbi:MAG: hypothetical protein KDE09_18665 [Anaerolineales bacterium]|nr:hypothetical protein [Anaerolineales bacterium]MCB8959817.1 hypothetical protein [Ardenticatenales bacterium]MCB0009631.1 hypothetical protein [Anaerolineales bacterium]MCB0011284.1 hypothetical protein [Anaerolineales bacterium]MCB0019823.1 hypothetical protein [Anaerolineales bacterium]